MAGLPVTTIPTGSGTALKEGAYETQKYLSGKLAPHIMQLRLLCAL